MDLLYQAAAAWRELTAYTYRITYGKKKTLHTVTLKFREDEFYHLAGFQYTKDIVLPVRFSRPKTLDVILSGKITEAHISKSENYPMIAERLSAITQLKAALETAFTVYQFNAKVLPFYTNIAKQINKVCNRAGLPKVGVHGLRHSFASLAYHLGWSEKVAMEIGGWADDRTMHRIYTHISQKSVEEASASFTKFFGG